MSPPLLMRALRLVPTSPAAGGRVIGAVPRWDTAAGVAPGPHGPGMWPVSLMLVGDETWVLIGKTRSTPPDPSKITRRRTVPES